MTAHTNESQILQALSWHFVDHAPDVFRNDITSLEAIADRVAATQYMLAKIVLGEYEDAGGHSKNLENFVGNWIKDLSPFPDEARDQMLVAHAEIFAIVDDTGVGRIVSDEALAMTARKIQGLSGSTESVKSIVKAIIDPDFRDSTTSQLGLS